VIIDHCAVVLKAGSNVLYMQCVAIEPERLARSRSVLVQPKNFVCHLLPLLIAATKAAPTTAIDTEIEKPAKATATTILCAVEQRASVLIPASQATDRG
jgi:hypothetical protein